VAGHFLVPVSASLTNPLDALILPRVLRWIAVVFRQKSKCGHLDAEDGRPWTRLPAKDLASQLLREEGLEVSVRRIQRSLQRLVEEGHLARCQRTKWWGQRDAWFSWSDEEWALQQHRPTAVARSSSVSSQSVRKRRSEAAVVTGQDLSIPLPIQTTSKTEQTSATSSLDGNSACVALQGASTNDKGHPTRSRLIRALEGIQAVSERAQARGFAGTKQPKGALPLSTEGSRWVEGDFVYEVDHLGRVTKDPLSTAPLR
jgi:hypothetical protein